jgi:hypothetical protein
MLKINVFAIHEPRSSKAGKQLDEGFGKLHVFRRR